MLPINSVPNLTVLVLHKKNSLKDQAVRKPVMKKCVCKEL